MTADVDELIDASLTSLAADTHVQQWYAKEHDWVSYFVMRHVVPLCRPGGVLNDLAQIAIEGSVAQPQGYLKPAVRRDIVLWPGPGMTCWQDETWHPVRHPLCIIEFKVHRPNRRNRHVNHEREWLQRYCEKFPPVGYAVEIESAERPIRIACMRFEGCRAQRNWRTYPEASAD